MAVVKNIDVAVRANTHQLETGMRRGAKTVQTSVSSMTSSLGRLVGYTGPIGLLVSALGGLAIGTRLAADMEQLNVAFKTMIGSGSMAKKLLEDITTFAAETPFELPELAEASKKLLAFGVSADEVVNELRRIGDVSSGIGAPISEIAEIYGKAKVQGRIFAEDINQLTGRGIPIIQELAKQFGVTEEAVRGLVSSGVVNFGHLQKAMVALTSDGGKFAGMMAAQSQTISGLWSTLKDSVGGTLREFGNGLSSVLKPALKIAIATSDALQRGVKGVVGFLQDPFGGNTLSEGWDEIGKSTTRAAAAVKEYRKEVEKVGEALFLVDGKYETLTQSQERFKAHMEAVNKDVEAFTEKLKPPVTLMDQYLQRVARLNELQAMGLLTLEQRNKLLAMAPKEFFGAEMDKRRKTMSDAAAGIRESVATPFENFTARLAELQKLRRGGFLDSGTFSRAFMQAREEFASSLERTADSVFERVQPPAAIERGTQEAFSAFQNNRDSKDLAKDQLAEQRKATRYLEQMVRRAVLLARADI